MYVLAVSASLLYCSFAATGEAILTAKLLKPVLGNSVVSPTEHSHDLYFLKLRHYSHLMVMNSSEELTEKEHFFHHSHYLGKWQQCVMLDYEAGALVAVRMFNLNYHAV